MIEMNWHPTEREQRQFVTFWLPGFFCVLGGLVLWRGGGLAWSAAVWGTGFVLCLAGTLVPRLRKVLWVTWMGAGFPLGWMMSHALLAAIFYLVLTPIGLIRRLAARDPLGQSLDPGRQTYWVPHNPGGDTARYFSPF